MGTKRAVKLLSAELSQCPDILMPRALGEDAAHYCATALAAARQWAADNKATFSWRRQGRSETQPHHELWECHVAVNGRYITRIGGYDFGPDNEPGGGNALLAESDAAARVQAGIATGGNAIMYPDD